MTMEISRRTLFRQLGAGAAVGLGIPSLARADSVETGLASAAADAAAIAGPVRLHRNENAFGPSAAVVAAIRTSGTGTSIVSRYRTVRMHDFDGDLPICTRSVLSKLSWAADRTTCSPGPSWRLDRAAR